MKAYIRAYANGEVCIKQRALLDTLIDATDKQLPAELEAVPQLEAVLMHVAGCDECRAVWHSRRRALRGRTAPNWLPLGPFLDAWDGLHARASGALHAAHNAAFWIAQRVGISSGDSAGAATVSGGAAVGGKAVAACVGAACAVGAAGSGLVGVVQPITPQAEHRPERPTKRTAAKPAVRGVLKPPPAGPRIVTAPPPPHAAASPKRTEAEPDRHFTPGDLPLVSTARTSTATGVGASQRPVTRDFTPGDLPPAPSNSTSSAPQPPLRAATSSDSPSSCTPGDLGC
jgi:hypothetical protein